MKTLLQIDYPKNSYENDICKILTICPRDQWVKLVIESHQFSDLPLTAMLIAILHCLQDSGSVLWYMMEIGTGDVWELPGLSD